MQTIIDYFSSIPTSHRSFILAGGITFFWLIESIIPLFKMSYNKWRHLGVNLFFTLTTVVVNFSMAFILVKASDWVVAQQWGVMFWIRSWPLALQALIGLALLDLIGAWLAHWVQHRVPALWKFHLVHHTDHWVDTTTANRHHPGESVIRFVFTTLGVLVVGAPMWLIFAYQSLSVIFSQLNHANIALPKKLDLWLSYVIISPDMHKIHHHYQLPYTDTNYGNIFAFWDRLFGTFASKSREEIVYGVDTYPDEKQNNSIAHLLRIPLNKKRKPTTLT